MGFCLWLIVRTEVFKHETGTNRSRHTMANSSINHSINFHNLLLPPWQNEKHWPQSIRSKVVLFNRLPYKKRIVMAVFLGNYNCHFWNSSNVNDAGISLCYDINDVHLLHSNIGLYCQRRKYAKERVFLYSHRLFRSNTYYKSLDYLIK